MLPRRPLRYAAAVSPPRPWTHLSGEAGFEHDYHDDRGQKGVVRVLPRNDGRTLHVDWVGPPGVGPGEVAHTSGVGNVRGVFDQLFQHYPEAKFVTGIRSGGAFAGKPTRIVRGIPGRLKRPARYAKADTRHVAHPLIEGHAIESALRHLANDPKNTDSVRSLSKTALTTDPSALWGLHDALHESGHPAKDWYSWLSAADKIETDRHVYHALSTAADANATADGLHYAYGEKRDNWRHRPEGVAQQAVFGMESRSPYRSTHDFVVARAKEMLPHATDKDIEESIRRHYVRASRVYDAERGHPMEGHNRRAIGNPDDHELRGEGVSYKNLKATRYRRVPRRPRRYGRADIEAALHAHANGHPVPNDVFNDMLQDEGGVGERIALAAMSRTAGMHPDAASAHAVPMAAAAGGYIHAPELTAELLRHPHHEDQRFTDLYQGRSGRRITALRSQSEPGLTTFQVYPHRYYPLDSLRVRYHPTAGLPGISANLAPWELHGLLPHIPEPHRARVAAWLASQIPEAAADHARHTGTDYGQQQRHEPGRMSRPKRYALAARGDFIDSLRRVRSRQQQALRRAAEQVGKRLGLHPLKTVDALHDSPQGATPGLAQAIYGGASPEAIQGAAAYLSMIGNQTGFGVFHVRPTGPDRLHRFRVTGSGLDLRHQLDRAGIADRVLVPHRSGWDLLIPDPGGRLTPNVEQFAKSRGAELQTSPGFFRVIGDADQSRAREMFRGTLERLS